ncbi:MAG: TIGR00282 family metallophosphoesterase [Candidatus Gracilibacteria bacterium]|nr:TIGR00282 family metallophosphoesterase [Candidatus Gracilibacteria bacterium]
MRVLIFGDIYGRVGRNAFKKHFLDIKNKYNPDFTIVNPENISSGRGPVMKHIKEIDSLGIDVYTSGNHIYDNYNDIKDYLDAPNSKLIRPANFYESEHVYFPGKGYKILEKDGKKLLVINLMSSTFLRDEMYNAFLKVDEMLKGMNLDEFNGIIIDFHRETTSEIYAMSMFLEGKVSFVYGTHTHIQTNDELILPGGTGLLTDVGMNGPLYSVIGADFEGIKSRFLSGVLTGKIDQALGKDYVVSACVVDIDEKTRKCLNIEKIRIRGSL